MRYLMERGAAFRGHLTLALLVACLPTAALALGFGSLSLSSHLNQALNADVPIILNTSDDIDKVHVALASQNEYRQLGLKWQPDLARVKVILQAKHSDRPYIALRSAGAIHTPILSILLKANKTGRGTYFKHFQLLMDPVESTALRQQQPVVMALRSTPVHSEPSETMPVPVAADAGWARIWRYGPVRAGDSLSEIAYRLRRDKRFSNRQVMLSLYEKNPNGFVDGDINLLKQGAWLTVPRGNVVKQYGDQASMQKISQLLTRTEPSTHAIQTPRLKPEPKLASKPKAKHKATPSASASPGQTAQQLRYSGSISVNGATADKLADDLKTVKSGFDQQFESMHADMMAGKLQMADLGKTVSNLNQSVQVIKQDIHSLKKDVAIIKSRTEHPVSESFSNFQLALFALLAAIFGALMAVFLRKKPIATPEPASTEVLSTQDGASNDKTASTLIADEAIQLLNRAEENLGKCDYEQTGKILRQIDKLTPGSVRASALKAQLFHETDRHTERNNLINSISEASDKQRWERFCQLLPSHVWNACFGDETGDDAPRNDGAQS
ncbi:MAG: FimV/HubP family polar landmark protein [Mariprofundus sp.]|nr:FimV/HubP family polar landmark protein [Mariprofundus sp.]